MHTNQQLARTRNACSGRQKQAEAGKGRQRQGVASSGRKWHEAMLFPEHTAGARGSRCRHSRAKRSGLRPYARAAAELGSSGLPAKAHAHSRQTGTKAQGTQGQSRACRRRCHLHTCSEVCACRSRLPPAPWRHELLLVWQPQQAITMAALLQSQQEALRRGATHLTACTRGPLQPLLAGLPHHAAGA
jgi:hypothetical protein